MGGLIALMAGASMVHFFSPKIYYKAVPRFLGNPAFWIFVSGVAQLTAAVLLAIPRTRRVGAGFTALLLIAVFPANLQMALDGPVPAGNWFTGSRAVLWLRLPIQPVLIYWAWTFRRDRSR